MQEILEQEELKYLDQFGIRRGYYNEDRLMELKANNPSSKDLSLDKIANMSPKLAVTVFFNDIETHNAQITTTNRFKAWQYSFILQKWHEKILANYGQGDLFRDQQNAELFSRALEKKASFLEVSDGKSQTLKVLTSFGDFYISKRGLPYSAEETDPYKFEFLSSG